MNAFDQTRHANASPNSHALRTRAYVRLRFGSLIVIVALASGRTAMREVQAEAVAQQRIYSCPRQTSDLSTPSLARAIEHAVGGGNSVKYVSDERPCVHSRELTQSLDRKLHARTFALARQHDYVLVKVNGNYFSVDEFTFDDLGGADAAIEALGRQPDRNLPGPGLATYQFAQIGSRIVVVVSDVHGERAIQPFVDAITSYLRTGASNKLLRRISATATV